MTTTTTTTTTLLERLHGLGYLGDVSPNRRVSLEIATAAGVDDTTLITLATASRLARRTTLDLPAGKYDHCSRGKGWARQGRGDTAAWGERQDNGTYRVGPGRWVVGSSDGFNRKDRVNWTVTAVRVGTETWTIAN